MRVSRAFPLLLVLICAAVGVGRAAGSLVGFWTLGEAVGSTAAADSSGFGNTGVCGSNVYIGGGRFAFAGCPTFGVEGAPGTGATAASFSSNQFLDVPNVIPNNFTVALWVKTTDYGPSWTQPGNPAYFGDGIIWSDIAGGANDMIPMSVVGGRLSFGTGEVGCTGYDTLTSTQPINTGQWIHVAVTRDSATGAKKMYINGALDASSVGGCGPLSANGMIAIGANPLDNRYFSGALQNVYFFNRVLSDSEILSLATLTSATSLPPVASAGGPYSGIIDQAVALDASQSYDPNIPPAALTYAWAVASSPAGSNGGTLTNAQNSVASFTPDVPGTYTVTLTVANGVGQATASASLVALEKPPLAVVGGPYSAVDGQGVTLDGSQSSDPNTPPAPLTFAWAVTSAPGGNGGTLVHADTATPTFTPDFPGTFGITLTVTNSVGETATATAFVNATAAVVASNGGTCSSYCQVDSSTTVSGNVTVSPGAYLEVDGAVQGNVNLSSGGTLVLSGGTLSGNLQVGTNSAVVVGGGTVTGNVTLSSGSTLQAYGATFNHNLQANGSGPVQIFGGTVKGNLGLSGATGMQLSSVNVTGNLTISGTTGNIFNYLVGVNVSGNLVVQDNGPNAPVNLGFYCGGGNSIGHNLTVQNNQGLMSIYNNTVGANLSCTNNSLINDAGDHVTGKATGQCSNATAPIDFNQCF